MRREASATPWNTGRALLYGAAIGFVAAAFKLLAPWSEARSHLAVVEQLVEATLGFALLCGLAAALRNFIARRLIWRS
jgi:hypothetical protein